MGQNEWVIVSLGQIEGTKLILRLYLVFSIVSGSKMDSILRYGTLIILVLQTTATVLLLRYSRTRPGQPYLASTAVMLNECCKFSVCVFSLFAQRGFSVRRSWRAFREEILGRPMETLKLIVPSGLYCLQNNLLFIALTNLDAATYQVSTYTLKRSNLPK